MEEFTENSFKIPRSRRCGGAEYYIIDHLGRPVIVNKPTGCWGCRYYVDSTHYVKRVVQGVIRNNQILVVATHDRPYRVGQLWGLTAIFIPPRVVKYPKVLPPNTTFKQMISRLQKKVLKDLHADLDKVDNCPNFSFPDPQQLEAELCDDLATIPAHLFEYRDQIEVRNDPKGLMAFLGNTRMSVPPGCEATYYVKDRLGRQVTVDGPIVGCWGCYYFVDSVHFEEKVFQGIVSNADGVTVFASNDKPYRVEKCGSETVIFIPPRVYKYPKVLPPNTTYKQMLLGVFEQECENLRADLAKVDHNCPHLSLFDDPQIFEAQYSEEDWEEMRVADGYGSENEQSDSALSSGFVTRLARL